MLSVIALGGNALSQPGEPPTADNLITSATVACQSIADALGAQRVVVVHGNGPQVGLLALQSEAYAQLPIYPFDILGAESQGMIGYLLQQALRNRLRHPVVTLLTQVLVDANDPAFTYPDKPIGGFYPRQQSEQLRQQHPKWHFTETRQGLRRVVASPYPRSIVELGSIEAMIDQKHWVVAGGGGGVPCIEDENGIIVGAEGVIDKDLTASLLARSLQADHFMILTDVDAIYENWGTDSAKPIHRVNVASLVHSDFERGSMQPKVRAACEFVSQTGSVASIGDLFQLDSIIQGQSGTHVYPDKQA